MGLMDMLGSALNNEATAQDQGLMDAAMQLVTDSKSGGLTGLIQAFQKNNLGEQTASWVGTGENLPISAEQILSVVGGERLSHIASQLGMSQEQVAAGLAQILPKVIDMLSQGGKLPESDELLSQGLNLLKGKLFG